MQTIRFYRRLRDVEQKELAKLLGVSNSMISRYEQGKAEINARDLLKISNFLRVPIEKFFLPIPVAALITNGEDAPHA